MRYVKHYPSRKEVNAAMLLYSPLPSEKKKIEKENEMKKQTENANDSSTVVVNEQALAVVKQTEQQALQSLSHETGLVMSEELMREISQSSAELEMSFNEYTSLSEFYKLRDPKDETKSVPFFVTNVVTILIANKKPKPGEDAMKPVHVFEFTTEDGLTFYPMCGANSYRDKIAKGFADNRLRGLRPKIGLLRLKQKETGQVQPAFIFETLPGFKLTYEQV
jgi:hypothetical protein